MLTHTASKTIQKVFEKGREKHKLKHDKNGTMSFEKSLEAVINDLTQVEGRGFRLL